MLDLTQRLTAWLGIVPINGYMHRPVHPLPRLPTRFLAYPPLPPTLPVLVRFQWMQPRERGHRLLRRLRAVAGYDRAPHDRLLLLAVRASGQLELEWGERQDRRPDPTRRLVIAGVARPGGLELPGY